MNSGDCVRLIVRWKIPLFALVALINLLSFNGQWRIGRDSALYRAVATNITEGQGYSFRGEPNTHIYPGLPLMLASIDVVFGKQDAFRPFVAQGVMLLMGVITLAIVYRLVRTHYPEWIAILVTVMLGLHYRFVQQNQELMTDVPFLMALSLSLLGFDYVIQSKTRKGLFWAIGVSLLGLALAVVLRPTFWALALAWALACVWGIIVRSRQRQRFVLALAMLIVVVGAWLALDPRTSAFAPLSAHYERRISTALFDPIGLAERSWSKIYNELFTEAVFATDFFPVLNTIFATLAIVGGAMLFRTQPLWGLVVITGTAACMLNGGVPRYYLMILPLLLLGWLLVVFKAARSISWNGPVRAVIVTLGLSIVIVPTVGNSFGIIAEQQGFTSSGRRQFLEVYDNGYWIPIVKMSDVIRQEVNADETVLGHEPRVLSYLSGRSVYGMGTGDFEIAASRMKKGRFDYAIFPDTLYRRDKVLQEMMNEQVVVPRPGSKMRSIGDQSLCRINIDMTRINQSKL